LLIPSLECLSPLRVAHPKPVISVTQHSQCPMKYKKLNQPRSHQSQDVREGSGLQLGKVGRTAAGVAVQVATAMPIAAVNMAGSAVKRGIRSVASK